MQDKVWVQSPTNNFVLNKITSNYGNGKGLFENIGADETDLYLFTSSPKN